MKAVALPRIDTDEATRRLLLPYCRLARGEVWEDAVHGHRVGVLDASSPSEVAGLFGGETAVAAVQDPPYNLSPGTLRSSAMPSRDVTQYLAFTRRWIESQRLVMAENSHFYLWMGADLARGFQPLPDVMILMREYPDLIPRSFITMRNQRGYGTQKNWMWVRQELLYYTKGTPEFRVVYTDIPKILKGYYKNVGGRMTENTERGKSPTIRPGNVWVDIQQVFYRLHENVPGAYAQKPLKAIERILESSSSTGELVTDFFAHSGTTLIGAERLGRRCYTFDLDPIYAELTIRRLEHYRATGETGWQTENPFPEIDGELAERNRNAAPLGVEKEPTDERVENQAGNVEEAEAPGIDEG